MAELVAMAAPYNPRKISDHDLASLSRSLKFFGAVEPIVCNRRSGRIVGGHQRVKAAQAIGIDSLPVAWVDLDDPSEKQLNLALNRVSGDWDDDALRELLQGLDAEGADLELTGFDDAELARLLEMIPDPPAGNSAIPTDVEKRCNAGDVWAMGDHRLMCGSAIVATDVAQLIGDAKITLAITSPPYAQQREYDTESGFEGIPADRYVEWFAAVADSVAGHLAADGSWLVNIKDHCEDGQRVLYVRDLVLAHARDWGWKFVDEFIWTHGGTPKTPKQRFKNGWEPIFHFTRGRHKFYPDRVMHATDDVPDWSGLHPNMEDVQEHGCTEGMARKGVDSRTRSYESRAGAAIGRREDQGTTTGGTGVFVAIDGMAYPSNVLSLGKNRDAVGHPAAYPVSLPDFFIRVLSDKGDAVFDPFMGSGSTLIAADPLDRVCFGMEISPKYCDVILQRWEQFTERKAERV